MGKGRELIARAAEAVQRIRSVGRADGPVLEPVLAAVLKETARNRFPAARDLALREFGLMARTVFRMWGINRTDDFGELVFNLVEAGLMSKTDEDSRKDFHAVYDLDEALERGYRIEAREEEAEGTS